MSRKRRYPKLYSIRSRPGGPCAVCGQPSVMTAVVHTSWFRSEDESFPLCQEHYSETGAKPLPRKDAHASVYGREGILGYWERWTETLDKRMNNPI